MCDLLKNLTQWTYYARARILSFRLDKPSHTFTAVIKLQKKNLFDFDLNSEFIINLIISNEREGKKKREKER